MVIYLFTKDYTPSRHYYKQKSILQIHSINDICGLYNKPQHHLLNKSKKGIFVNNSDRKMHFG